SSTATSLSIGKSAPAISIWKFRASIHPSCTPPGSPPDSAPTISASTAVRKAAARSSPSSASDRACLWCRATKTSAPPAPTPPNAARWKTPSPSRCSGASPSPPRAMAASWSTPPISSCATATGPPPRSAPGPPPTTSTARAAPSICRAPKPSARTPRSKSPSPSPMRPRVDAAGSRGPTRDRPPSSSPIPPARLAPPLPDDHYQPRYDDPRAGYGGLAFVDYSTPIGEPMVKRYIRRHRLEKKDASAAVSEPVKPIQYWVDPGAPEDVRRALIEGASWWNQAFEAAGFRNAFQVAVLPDGADPMDIRYNMINWVHRSTRGWSMGGTVSDPRTGEIIKGTVTLGSLRDRQDYLIFEGLLSPYETGNEKPPILYQTALARIRQLAAHEVGHTLGLDHNYYDSSLGWISVMDYPHPQEKLRDDGTIDISEAYAARIGEWDKVAIDYGYRVLPQGDEPAQLARILNDAWAKDLRFMTNQDTDLHPRVDQWSNGVNQADELNRLMKVRRAALSRIGEHTIRNGAPMATIEEPLVPIFMYHRYAVESAASMVAGQDYTYAMRGDGRSAVKWESGANQRKALDALAATLTPAELAVPRQVLDAIPARPPGFGRHRELFPRTTGDAFDPLSPATVAADVTIGFTLQLDRAARMVAQHAVDPTLPGLEEVIDRLTKATFDAPAASPYQAEIRRFTERVFVDRVIWLATGAPNGQVRAIAAFKLDRLAARLSGAVVEGESERAQHRQLAADIKRFLERAADTQRVIPASDAPPGAPIGGDSGMDWLAPAPWR